MTRIDAHHHLWIYSPAEYGWINERMEVLRRDFLPDDLKLHLEHAGINGAVTVQARQTFEETEWLLDLAENESRIAGVVGWAPIASPEFPAVLERLSRRKFLKGLRHIIQDEPNDSFILGPAFNRGIRALRETALVYDILIYARHLPQTITFVDMHPDQVFVLDHCAKPPIRDGKLEPWATQMRDLARRPNVCCKVSGLVTEAEQHWTPASLAPWWHVVLEAFGPERLLFGSDWPVALLASNYQQWVDTVTQWTAELSIDEQAAIWGGNAQRIYRL